MYLLHRLREAGFTSRVFERADDVGGTWYWNRYPGARCDIRSIDYSYSFSPELEQEWEWSEKFATQPEILRYAQHVAERFDLYRDIDFETSVDKAVYDDDSGLWHITTSRTETVRCRHYVMATGCLSTSKLPELPGHGSFTGPTYHTGHWPHHEIDFTGLRVGVVGTGSSGIQSTPVIASQAAELTVFQRTPNFSMPAHNGSNDPDELAAVKAEYPEYRQRAKYSAVGVPADPPTRSALDVDEEERNQLYEAGWQIGGLGGLGVFNDLRLNQQANDTAAEFVRNKIRSIVDEPELAETLCPTDYPYGTKRLCVDDGYYSTFNLDHVRLVDLKKTPLERITTTGVETTDESFEFDAIVFATGFDAMTGAIVNVDITGVGDRTIKNYWEDGPKTYLGLTVAGFPNFYAITGPGSPSVLSNMMVSIEQHVDWIMDCIEHMREAGLTSIEPTPEAEAQWGEHVVAVADLTLYPKANSWYMGANVKGKPRVILPYIGGVGEYRRICDEVAVSGYSGFILS